MPTILFGGLRCGMECHRGGRLHEAGAIYRVLAGALTYFADFVKPCGAARVVFRPRVIGQSVGVPATAPSAVSE